MENAALDDVRPGGRWRRLAISAVAVLAIVAGIYFLEAGQDGVGESAPIGLGGLSGPAPRVGAVAPDFQLSDLDGKPVRLSDFRGKVVWLNFWASWCPPCRAEAPDVEAAWKERRESGLILLGVDLGESPATVREYASSVGVTYPLLLDPDQVVGSQYHISNLPTHIFIDRDGVIRGVQLGVMSKSSILKRLAGLLAP